MSAKFITLQGVAQICLDHKLALLKSFHGYILQSLRGTVFYAEIRRPNHKYGMAENGFKIFLGKPFFPKN